MTALPVSLDFQGITLSVTDHKGRPWLTLNEVARALYGIKGGDETVTSFDEENKKGRSKNATPFNEENKKGSNSSVGPFTKVYNATLRTFKTHADEFTADETALIELSTAGGLQKVRVFSIRGCRLMGMVSRAPMAKPFRKWALDQFDVLDALALPAAESQPSPPEPIDGFTPGQMEALKALVEQQVTSLVVHRTTPAPVITKTTRPICLDGAAKRIRTDHNHGWQRPIESVSAAMFVQKVALPFAVRTFHGYSTLVEGGLS